ncbi:MAG: hypothetical protein RBU37_14470 [Myxococcota bacterium]|nr:hypothetical protein [Myxococcota bacterium]
MVVIRSRPPQCRCDASPKGAREGWHPGGTGQAPNQQLGGQAKRPIDKILGEQAKRPITKKT